MFVSSCIIPFFVVFKKYILLFYSLNKIKKEMHFFLVDNWIFEMLDRSHTV